MGGFSNFAISFSIISILTGAVLLFGYGLKFAGPVINSVGSPTSWYFQLAVMVAIMVPQVIINAVGIRLTARLNDFSVWWHLAGVATIAALLTFLGAHHNPAGFLLQHVTTVTPLEASSVD